MKAKLNVVKGQRGTWSITASGQGSVSGSFRSKADAVAQARSQSSPDKVVVRNSAGQVIRPPTVKTSKNAAVMRAAVFEVIRDRATKQTPQSKGSHTQSRARTPSKAK